jgi:hypothetical protein
VSPSFALLVGLWATSAFAPGALERQLAAAGGGIEPLPVGLAVEEARRLQVIVHRDAGDVPAAYVAPVAGSPPRLALHGPGYLHGLELRPLTELTVDLVEGYFHALLEGFLEHEVAAGSVLGQELRRRSATALPEVPAAHRLEAYLDAQASFAAHLLSIANELDRSETRRRAQGRSLCRHLGEPLPLFALWEQALGDAPYVGAYVVRGPHGEEHVQFSVSGISREDKRLMVERVLRAPWSGSAAGDLRPRLCAR